MDEWIDIAQIARQTGLSSRALRFYEGRGLVRSLRADNGRRLYGRPDLERLSAIQALKRAGFSLGQIGAMLGHRPPDFAQLITAQIDELDSKIAQASEMRTLLVQIQSRIENDERLDVATLCSLIRKGKQMDQSNWQAVADRYFTPEQQAVWKARMAALPAGFDQADYAARWRELGGRIAAALPLDPASETARGFVREWFELLKPFSAVATPGMWQESIGLYSKLPEWQAEANPGFGYPVWQFIAEAAALMRASGEDVGPLPDHLQR